MDTTGHQTSQPRGLMLRIDLIDGFVPPHDSFLMNLAYTIRSQMQSLLPQQSTIALSLITVDDMNRRDGSSTEKPSIDPGKEEFTGSSKPEFQVRPLPRTRFFIDRTRDRIALDDEILQLTAKEREIFNYLVDNTPRVIDRVELITRLWGSDRSAPNPQVVDVHVRRLRQKLRSGARHVKSSYGRGYYFEDGDSAIVQALPTYSG